VTGVQTCALPISFGFDIRWDSRVEDVPDDITNELFNYLGGPVMYNTVPVLEPFRGYWVENTSSPAEDRSLWLPYEENTKKSTVGVPPIAKAANADDWRLSLELLAGGVKDDLLTLGVRDRATDGYDAQDYGQPPYPEGRFLALSSVMAAVGGDQERQLAGDFRQPGAEGWRFTVWARGDVGSVVQLRQGSRSRLPQTFAVALYDPATGLKYDVSDINGLVLPNALTASGTMYEVLVGEKSWVEDQNGEDAVIPVVFSLRQNYPNPFNPLTTIQFELPAPSRVKLDIFDTRGRRVATLVNRSYQAGIHKETWTGLNSAGSQVASGVYFYRITSDKDVETRRMLLLK